MTSLQKGTCSTLHRYAFTEAEYALFSYLKQRSLQKQSSTAFYCTQISGKLPQKIGFIGDGAMAKAICRSIERKGLIDYSQVYVSSPYPKNLDSWKALGANVSIHNAVVAKESDVIFLAVKPHILKEALQDISRSPLAIKIRNKLFVSILAGITTKDLEEMLSKFDESRVVRVMPNTPMLVGEGCTVYCPGSTVTEEDLQLVHRILEVTGMCKCVPEHMINAVGAVTSSGPAFVYLFIEALSDGGVRMGLHRDMSTRFAAQTVMGAAKMVLETSKHVGTLKDEVCSAGGQTIAGTHALERGGVSILEELYSPRKYLIVGGDLNVNVATNNLQSFKHDELWAGLTWIRGSVMDAVEAAALRAAELGKQGKQ